MANMSYCRFENTLNDFRDCLRALRESGYDSLGEDEAMAARNLIRLAGKLSKEFGNVLED